MEPRPSPLVRAAALTHFAEEAHKLGLNAAHLLAEAGLPSHCLADPDLKVSARAVCQVLEWAAERGQEPAFALRMVQQRRLSNIGPLALLVRDQPTLRDALESIVRHLHLHNEALGISIEPDEPDGQGDLIVIREDLQDVGGPRRQAHELVVGATFKMLGLFLGSGWQPRWVCFAHTAPADTTMHRRLFGTQLAFGCEFSGLVCAAADLAAPNPGADPVLARYALRMIDDAAARPAAFSARVRELIVLLLPRGHCRVERVAQHLGVDRRTIGRRLAAEGTSFSTLLDQVRVDLMGRYRADGRRALSDVCALLGFSAPSALSRWHRQRFGRCARAEGSAPAGERAGQDPGRGGALSPLLAARHSGK